MVEVQIGHTYVVIIAMFGIFITSDIFIGVSRV